MPASKVKEYVLNNAGMRPWDRDPIDKRIIADIRADKGKIIDSQDEVGGYPNYKETRHDLSEKVPMNFEEWLTQQDDLEKPADNYRIVEYPPLKD